MGLKDWKRIKKWVSGEIWQKGKGEFVKIVYYDDLKFVNVYYHDKLDFEKEFKMKSQAMRYARGYMRTH